MSPQTSYLSEIDPEFAKVAALLPPSPSLPLDVLAIRESFRGIGGARGKNAAHVEIPAGAVGKKSFTISVGDAVEIKAVSYIPTVEGGLGETEGHTYPLLFWTHGGGFCLGDHEMDEVQLLQLSYICRLSIISVDYRLAPEHPFPTGLNDSYTALKWAAVNSRVVLGADLAKGFVVGGISAGGNFAAVLAHLARDDSTFPGKLTGQILIIPPLLSPSAVPEAWKEELTAHQENVNAPMLDMKYVEGIEAVYQMPVTDPRASPALLPSHKGLPPAYISAAGLDPLRDDAFLYQRLLEEAGVPVKLDAYKGVPHGFVLMFPTFTVSTKYAQDLVGGAKWLLKGAPKS